MNKPSAEQEKQYEALVAAGVDPDVAAYVAGTDECGCTMPWHSCTICRGLAKLDNGPADLAERLEVAESASVVIVNGLNGLMVVVTPSECATLVEIERGLAALVDSGYYREYSIHVGGRTGERGVAEPIEGRASGPTFTLDWPGKWQAVPQERS